MALGIIRLSDRPAAGKRLQYERREIAFADIQKSFIDPLTLLKNTYLWGQPGLDGLNILHNLHRVGEALGLDVSIDPVGEWSRRTFLQGATQVTEANANELHWQLLGSAPTVISTSAGVALQVVPAKSGDLPGVAFMPFAKGAASKALRLTDQVTLKMKAGFDIEGGAALIVRPSKGIDLLIDLAGAQSSSNTEISATLEYAAGAGAKTVVLGVSGGSRFEFDALDLSLGARISGSARSIYGELALQQAAIVIVGGKNADGFVAKLLPDEIRAEASLTLGLDSTAGLYFTGSGGLEIQLPVHIEIGPLEITGALIAIKPSANGIPVDVAATIKGNLGPLTAVVENIGMRANFSFPSSGGNLGPLDLEVGFRPPNGVGLAIDAGVVIGGVPLHRHRQRPVPPARSNLWWPTG